jgi:hypothetical protein
MQCCRRQPPERLRSATWVNGQPGQQTGPRQRWLSDTPPVIAGGLRENQEYPWCTTKDTTCRDPHDNSGWQPSYSGVSVAVINCRHRRLSPTIPKQPRAIRKGTRAVPAVQTIPFSGRGPLKSLHDHEIPSGTWRPLVAASGFLVIVDHRGRHDRRSGCSHCARAFAPGRGPPGWYRQ